MMDQIQAFMNDALKWIVGSVLTFIGLVLVRMNARQNDTFTKSETEHMIDLKVVPLVQSLDRHSMQLERQTAVLEKVNDSLQLIHGDMARVQTKVENLERVHTSRRYD